MKGEKPLRATVNFSIEHTRPRKAYVKTSLVSEETLGNIQSQEGNENVKKKTIGLISKTTTLHMDHAFLCISMPFLHDYNAKMPNFAFYA